jgi:Ca2+-binding RTX toxin-like protein
MATFDVDLSGSGISDSMFPGTNGRPFAVTDTDADFFQITYLDAGLEVVEFRSSTGNLTFSGNTPTGGTFDSIVIDPDIFINGAELAGFAAQNITLFNNAALAPTILAGNDTFTGATGADILRAFGGNGDADIYVGETGNDTFVIDGGAGELHGSAANGTGGAGETNTVEIRGNTNTFAVSNITDIDALTFAGSANTTASFRGAPVAGGLSDTLAVTGDNFANKIEFLALTSVTSFVIDLSGLTLTNWTQGSTVAPIDHIEIEGSSNIDTITGSIFQDLLRSSGDADTLVGKGGNDLFIVGSNVDPTAPTAIHGANADGSGGAGETNLIFVAQNDTLDLRNTIISNIDGFFARQASIDSDAVTGAITDRDGVAVLEQEQFGTDIDVFALITADLVVTTAFEILFAAPGQFNASIWTLTNIDPTSLLHTTGSSGIDEVLGWSAADVMVLGGGADEAAGGAGNDTIFGDAGDDVMSGGSGADTLHGGANLDTLTGGLGKDTLDGGLNNDFFDFNTKNESVKGVNRDVIIDFSGVIGGELDRIDLSTIDAKSGINGNQKFKFIGGQKFHDVKGELHIVKKVGFVVVEGDINGDGRADFQIEVDNVANLAKADFIL